MLKVNMFIYYGVILNKEDYENLTKKHGIKNLYGRIFTTGLTFRDVGEIGKSWTYIIGKENYWETDNITDMSYENNEFSIDNKKIKLTTEDETAIREKLLQLGITNIPKYRIFTCWE